MLKKIFLHAAFIVALFLNHYLVDRGISFSASLLIGFFWLSLNLVSFFFPKKGLIADVLYKSFIATIVIFFILIPLKDRIIQKNNLDTSLAHDGLIQTEYAVELLSKGRNIYSEDAPLGLYGVRDTYVPFTEKNNIHLRKLNPAYFHYIYPPLYTLQSLPFYEMTTLTLGWFDQRLVLLIYFLIGLYVLFNSPLEKEMKFLGFFLFFLNPYFLKFFLEGRNDIVVFLWILLSLISLHKKKDTWALFSITIACLMKQTAWICLPFIYLYIYHSWKIRNSEPIKVFFKKIALDSFPSILLGAIVLVPFIIWDFKGLWTDMILYPSGKLPTSYPVNGYSLLALLIKNGFEGNYLGVPLKSIFDYYPVIKLQGPVYCAIFIWTHFRLKKHTDISICIFQMSLALFSFWFLSRFYHDNYIEFNFRLFLLAWFFKKASLKPQRVIQPQQAY